MSNSPSSKPGRVLVNAEGVPINVEHLVDYQESSIVSREIYARDTGTITAFAFDGDQGLSEHSAPYDAYVHVLDGAVLITIGGKTQEVTKGQMILMPANVPHALKALSPFKMLLIMMRSHPKPK